MKQVLIILLLIITIGVYSQSRPLINTKTHFIFEVEVDDQDTISLPLINESTYEYNFQVTWGDGFKSMITSATDPDTAHIYRNAGRYDITINGLCEGFSMSENIELVLEEDTTGDNNLKSKLQKIKNWGSVGFERFDVTSCYNLIEVESPTVLDVTLMDSLMWMFASCHKLEYVSDISLWDVSNIITTRSMNTFCYSLKALPITNWNTENLEETWAMNWRCYSIKNVDISPWYTGKLRKINSMFAQMHALEQCLMYGWTLPVCDSVAGIFYQDTLLTQWFDPDLWWDNEIIIDGHNAFAQDSLIQNFADIPIEWRKHSSEYTFVWYIRPEGGDYGVENGGSYNNAWDGFDDIRWDKINAGDTIYICGTHNEYLTIEDSGDEGNDIVFSGGYSEEAGIIDGQNAIAYCIDYENQTDLTIRDITLKNTTDLCIKLVDELRITKTNITTDGCN